ncbi:MAG: hypothetical protein KF805_01855 [Phycisphaeraceae bacterium]|nr:hypothetical protein [Phycisphaeraceae bacterium]
MSESARISSVTALRDLKTALAQFIEQINVAFASVDAEIGRMGQWLQQERPAYYKHAVRRAEDAVTRAKSEISRKQYMRAPEPVSVVEERKALEKVKRRLEELQRKQEAVRKWAPRWEREAMMYKSTCRPLNEYLQATLPRAIERLEKMAVAIEDYLRLQAASPDLAPVDSSAFGESWTDQPDAFVLRSTVEKYAHLRAMILSPEAASELRAASLETPWQAGTVTPNDAESIAKLSVADAPPGDDDLVFVAWRAVACEAVFLARRTGAAPVRADGRTDSGWFIGPLDKPEQPGGYACATVEAFARLVPNVRSLLALRPGSLAVLASGTIRSILDEGDRELWHSEAT